MRTRLAYGPCPPLLAFACALATVCAGEPTIAPEEGEVKTSPGVEAKFRTRGAEADPIFALAFSPDGKLLAGATAAARVSLWRIQTREARHLAASQDEGLSSLAFSPDGTVLAAGGGDGTLRVWDVASGKEVAALKAASAGLLALAMAPDGNSVAAADSEGGLNLWDWRAGSQRTLRKGEGASLWSIAFSGDGKLLAAGGEKTRPMLCEPGADKAPRMLGGPPKADEFGAVAEPEDATVHALLFLPGGRYLLTLQSDQRVRAWDLASGREAASLKLGAGAATRMACSPDGALLAFGQQEGTVTILELASGKEALVLQGHERQVEAVAFGPDGRFLASSAGDGVALVWDLAKLDWAGAARASLKGAEPALAAGEEGVWQALASDEPAVAQHAVWDLAGQGAQGPAWLRKRLTSVAGGRHEVVLELLGHLDSEEFQAREMATAGLRRLGSLALSELEAAARAPRAEESQRRVTDLLALIKPLPLPPGEDRRTRRAIQVLEILGTPDARALLEELSKGDGAAWLTQFAREALTRLAARPAAGK